MNSELVINRYDHVSKNEKNKSSIFNIFKSIFSNSLTSFGIFLSAIFVIQAAFYLILSANNITIGINEVIVSFIGFLNVFFLKVFQYLPKN